MKQILLIILLFVTISSLAQQQRDTVVVWRLLADTTTGERFYDPLYGRIKEVRELHNTSEGLVDPFGCVNCHYQDYWAHVTYIDLYNNPIPFNIVVLETPILRNQPVLKSKKETK